MSKMLKTYLYSGFFIWLWVILLTVLLSIPTYLILFAAGVISPAIAAISFLSITVLMLPISWIILGYASHHVLKVRIGGRKA